MALTETTLDDKIEIVGEYKHVQIRTEVHTQAVKDAYETHAVAQSEGMAHE